MIFQLDVDLIMSTLFLWENWHLASTYCYRYLSASTYHCRHLPTETQSFFCKKTIGKYLHKQFQLMSVFICTCILFQIGVFPIFDQKFTEIVQLDERKYTKIQKI